MNDNVRKEAHETPPKQLFYLHPAGQMAAQNEVDLVRLFKHLIASWKLITVITVFGSLLIAAITLAKPDIYRQNVVLSPPSTVAVIRLNWQEYREPLEEKVFQRYYDYLRSPKRWDEYRNGGANVEFGELPGSIMIEVMESTALPASSDQPDNLLPFPTRVNATLIHTDPAAPAAILQDYLDYTNRTLLADLEEEKKALIKSKMARLDAEIELLREREKISSAMSDKASGPSDSPIDGLPLLLAQRNVLATANTGLEPIDLYSIEKSPRAPGTPTGPGDAAIIFAGILISLISALLITILRMGSANTKMDASAPAVDKPAHS